MRPDGWKEQTLEDLAAVAGGGTPRRSQSGYWNGDIPWATPTDVTGLRGREISSTADTITREGLEGSSARLLPRGSLLMTTRATIGACAITGAPMATNQGFQNLIPRQGTPVNFLYYLIQFSRKELNRLAAGSTFRELSKTSVRRFRVLVPSLAEQRKIAAVLTSVDDAIEKTQTVIDQGQTLKRGLMRELLFRGLPGRHMRFKTTEIGVIPEAWHLTSLSEVAEIRRGASPRPIRDPKWFSEEGPGWVRIADVTRSDRVLRRTNQALSKFGESKSVPVRPGDLIMSICATIGKPVILGIQACIHDGFVVFKGLRTHVRRDYLYYQLQAAEQRFVGRGQPGTQKNLNTTIVRRSLIPLPPVDEQDAIARILWAADDRIAANKRFREGLERIRESLMSVLLTGELRVTPDPEPE